MWSTWSFSPNCIHDPFFKLKFTQNVLMMFCTHSYKSFPTLISYFLVSPCKITNCNPFLIKTENQNSFSFWGFRHFYPWYYWVEGDYLLALQTHVCITVISSSLCLELFKTLCVPLWNTFFMHTVQSSFKDDTRTRSDTRALNDNQLQPILQAKNSKKE